MNFTVLSLVVLCGFYSHVASEPRSFKGGSYIYQDPRGVVPAQYSNDYFLPELHQSDLQVDDIQDYSEIPSKTRNAVAKTSDSNARLFIRRFLGLKNLFGKKNQPIIIRVFLNGTSVVTNTPTVPTNPTAPTGPTIPTNLLIPRNDDTEVTDDDITYSEQPASVNYKRKEAKKSQDIMVRIPAKYRHLFSNGQKVKLSINSGDKNRRLGNRRNNVNPTKHNSKTSKRNKNN